MAHELDYTNGQWSFAVSADSLAGPAWHRLGQTVPTGASIDAWKQAANYTWTIKQAPVEYAVSLDNGTCEVALDRANLVNYRSDTGYPLSVVSDGYRIVQPDDIVDFMFAIAKAADLAPEALGMVRHGRRFFMVARNGTMITPRPNDPVRLYATICSSADRSLATHVFWSSIRAVCSNTIRLALAKHGSEGYKCSHRTDWKPEEAAAALGIEDARESFALFGERMAKLADRALSPIEATEFFSQLLRPQKEEPVILSLPEQREKELVKVREIRGLSDLEHSYTHAPGAVPGTWYGAVQAVSHFVDWSRGKDQGKRLDSAMFSQGSTLKTKAFEEACKKANVH